MALHTWVFSVTSCSDGPLDLALQDFVKSCRVHCRVLLAPEKALSQLRSWGGRLPQDLKL